MEWYFISFFLSDNQGTQENDQPKKEDEDGGSCSVLSHNTFLFYACSLFSQSQSLFLRNASLSSKQSLSSTAVYAANVATRYCILSICRCSLSFIDFEGRSDGDSIKRILSIVKPRQLVRSVLCTCTCMSIAIPSFPFPSPPILLHSHSSPFPFPSIPIPVHSRQREPYKHHVWSNNNYTIKKGLPLICGIPYSGKLSREKVHELRGLRATHESFLHEI